MSDQHDPRPDHTEDPRTQEQASEGLPETAPGGSDKESDEESQGDDV